jgi:hypothetical protein
VIVAGKKIRILLNRVSVNEYVNKKIWEYLEGF